MDQQVQQFEEWHTLIAEWHKYHKSTSPGTTTRLKKRFAQYSFDYFKLMSEYRKTGKPSLLSKADAIYESAEKEIKTFKRYELIGTLSK